VLDAERSWQSRTDRRLTRWLERQLVGVGEDPAEYLMSWVPAEFDPAADRGICVNPVDCIQWIEASDLSLKNQLRDSDFLD
jgi:hypothetical protein